MTDPRLILRGGSEWATPIFVGRGLLGDAGFWGHVLPSGHRIGLVSDEHVAQAVLPRLEAVLPADRCSRIVIPAGESSKSRSWKARIEDQWLENGLGRDSLAVAVGGGVVVSHSFRSSHRSSTDGSRASNCHTTVSTR